MTSGREFSAFTSRLPLRESRLHTPSYYLVELEGRLQSTQERIRQDLTCVRRAGCGCYVDECYTHEQTLLAD